MEQNESLVGRAVKLSAKISNVFLPFTSEILTNVLLREKFSLPSREYEVQAGETLRIAEKNSALVEFNESSRLISLITTEVPEEIKVIEIFESVLNSIVDFVGKSKLKFQFYEFDFSGIQPSKKNPLHVFAQENNKSRKLNELNELFGEKVSNFGLRLFPSKHIIDSTDWFEYTIQPFIFVPESIYQIRMIYRNKNLDNVIASLSELRAVTKKLIDLLEKE